MENELKSAFDGVDVAYQCSIFEGLKNTGTHPHMRLWNGDNHTNDTYVYTFSHENPFEE